MTFLASTGDSAAPGEFPAFSPNVVAVGGTTLTINSSTYAYVSETGWSDGGGGQSEYEAKPSYQNGVNSTAGAQIPDVSFDADPNTGVAIMDSYDYGSSDPWIQVGGTSVASPCWAGLVAIGDQLRTAAGLATMDGPTQTLPLLYGMKAGRFPRHHHRQQRLSGESPATTWSPASAARWPTTWCPISCPYRRRAT